MTSPTSEPVAPPPAKPTSRWEDFIDIFYAPRSVFERRQDQSPWPTIWIVTVVLTLVTVLTFNAIAPVFETETRAAFTKAMAKTPQLTQDIVEKQVSFGLIGRKWGVVAFPIIALVVGLFVWLVGKIVGSKATYQQALVVVAYSSVIGLAQAIVIGAQGLVMDVSSLTTVDQLSLSAARFMDKATASPALYAILKQIDVFGIWGLIVTAIGVQVTGKLTRQRAIVFAVIWWGVGTLIAFVIALRQAA
jgi:membrane protein, antimicrobial resistance system